ncbi:MAG: hypothetical protein LBS81_03235 [Endomicrobium sp.]|nr:hypothetical protein [Endomicrobium sp.]
MVYMPQVYKTWKTKSAKDISIEMFIINILSVLLWITYGLISRKPPIYLTNIVVFTLFNYSDYYDTKIWQNA